jgi:hypothetical protein
MPTRCGAPPPPSHRVVPTATSSLLLYSVPVFTNPVTTPQSLPRFLARPSANGRAEVRPRRNGLGRRQTRQAGSTPSPSLAADQFDSHAPAVCYKYHKRSTLSSFPPAFPTKLGRASRRCARLHSGMEEVRHHAPTVLQLPRPALPPEPKASPSQSSASKPSITDRARGPSLFPR